MYCAAKQAILTIRENPNNLLSLLFFKTITIDNGQYLRIIWETNMEMEVVFPVISIHFVDVRYLVQQQRICERRTTMQVRFILSNVNNFDSGQECIPFEAFQRVNIAIRMPKNTNHLSTNVVTCCIPICPKLPSCSRHIGSIMKCGFWETSSLKYKDWIERYLFILASFTSHLLTPLHITFPSFYFCTFPL